MAFRTEEEIRIAKILDQMDLERLEDNRRIYDMDGYQDRTGGGKGREWRAKPKNEFLTDNLMDGIVSMGEEDA